MVHPTAKIGYRDIPNMREEELLKAVANQTISAGIDASSIAVASSMVSVGISLTMQLP